MSIRCGVCGKFIAYNDSFITDYEPSSHFGPEVIDHAHTACAQADRNPKGQDAEERLGAKHESAVGTADAPKEA